MCVHTAETFSLNKPGGTCIAGRQNEKTRWCRYRCQTGDNFHWPSLVSCSIVDAVFFFFRTKWTRDDLNYEFTELCAIGVKKSSLFYFCYSPPLMACYVVESIVLFSTSLVFRSKYFMSYTHTITPTIILQINNHTDWISWCVHEYSFFLFCFVFNVLLHCKKKNKKQKPNPLIFSISSVSILTFFRQQFSSSPIISMCKTFVMPPKFHPEKKEIRKLS